MKYVITKYYSGYCTHEVEAGSEAEAWEKVNKLPINYDEVASTLEPWKDADEIEQED